MSCPTRSTGRLLVTTALLFGGAHVAPLLGGTQGVAPRIEPPLSIQLDGPLTATPLPGGGNVIGPRTIGARLIVPGGQGIAGQARLFGLSGHPKFQGDVFFMTVNLPGEMIHYSEIKPIELRGFPEAPNVPRVRALRIGNVRTNLHGGRVGETIVLTGPAAVSTAVQRYDSAFRETSARQQETLADGTRITYWNSPLTWHLVPQPGVAQPIGTDIGFAFSNPDFTGSIDYMQLASDRNAIVVVGCSGATGTTPTCTFSGAGTFRGYFGTAVVRSLATLGLSPGLFLGASALDVSEVPSTTCPQPARPPGPVFFDNGRSQLIGAWNAIPCADGYDANIAAPSGGTLFQQRIDGGTAFAVSNPGGLTDGLTLNVTASNGSGGTGSAPLIIAGMPRPGCQAGGPPPPTNVRGHHDRLGTGEYLDWDYVDCAAAYLVRAYRSDGTRPDGASETFIVASSDRFEPRRNDVSSVNFFEVACVGADGSIGPFSPRVQVMFPF